MKTIATFIIVLLTSVSVFACRCTGVDEFAVEDLTEATEIFKGRVIKIEKDTSLNLLAVTFRLSENYLDSTDLGNKTIYTFTNPAICGLSLKLDDEWYIHSKNREGVDFSSSCGRSANLTIPKLDRENPPDFYIELKEHISWYFFVEMTLEPFVTGLTRYNDDLEKMKKITAANKK